MGFLTPVLKVVFGWIVSALMNEVKEAWADKDIQGIAKDAVKYAEARFDKSETKEKKEAALDKLGADAKEVGIKIGKDVASEVIELAVERFLK